MVRLFIVALVSALSFSALASEQTKTYRLSVKYAGFSHENGSDYIESFSCSLGRVYSTIYDKGGWDDGFTEWKELYSVTFTCLNDVSKPFEMTYENIMQRYRSGSTLDPDYNVKNEFRGSPNGLRDFIGYQMAIEGLIGAKFFEGQQIRVCSYSGFVLQPVENEKDYVTICMDRFDKVTNK